MKFNLLIFFIRKVYMSQISNNIFRWRREEKIYLFNYKKNEGERKIEV